MADTVDAAAAMCPLPAEPCTNFPEFRAYNTVHPSLTAVPSGAQCSLRYACSYAHESSQHEPDSLGR